MKKIINWKSSVMQITKSRYSHSPPPRKHYLQPSGMCHCSAFRPTASAGFSSLQQEILQLAPLCSVAHFKFSFFASIECRCMQAFGTCMWVFVLGRFPYSQFPYEQIKRKKHKKEKSNYLSDFSAFLQYTHIHNS